MISGFQGDNRWLSNFWPAKIQIGDIVYPTVEHAYVAAKPIMPFTPADLEWFLTLTPAKAKKVGRELDVRPDWDDVKIHLMQQFTELKYSTDNPELRSRLIKTGDEEIIEENTWGDTFWGICNGEGHNWLGIIIMATRDKIMEERFNGH